MSHPRPDITVGCHTDRMMQPRDYSALTSAVTTSDVAQSKRELAGRGGPTLAKGVWATILIVIFVVVGILFRFDFPAVPDIGADTGRSPVSWVVVGVIIVGVVVGAVLLGRVIEKRAWTRFIRLTRFATANGLVYSANGNGNGTSYPGLLFSIGGGRQFTGVFSHTEAPGFDIGNYRYRTGSGKNQRTHVRGYVAMRLERKLPHMVLDAVGNNGLFGTSNLPRAFGRDQILSLEGDFNTYFTLYCPREYERDALYVFTPDLMALLIDNASALDVEIVDDWMFVYSMQPFALDEPGALEPLFGVIETVGAKTLTQTDRYRDDRASASTAVDEPSSASPSVAPAIRLPTDEVAPQGRRLSRGVPTAAILTFIGFVVVMYTFILR